MPLVNLSAALIFNIWLNFFEVQTIRKFQFNNGNFNSWKKQFLSVYNCITKIEHSKNPLLYDIVYIGISTE